LSVRYTSIRAINVPQILIICNINIIK
jgi:hypothetical protein